MAARLQTPTPDETRRSLEHASERGPHRHRGRVRIWSSPDRRERTAGFTFATLVFCWLRLIGNAGLVLQRAAVRHRLHGCVGSARLISPLFCALESGVDPSRGRGSAGFPIPPPHAAARRVGPGTSCRSSHRPLSTDSRAEADAERLQPGSACSPAGGPPRSLPWWSRWRRQPKASVAPPCQGRSIVRAIAGIAVGSLSSRIVLVPAKRHSAGYAAASRLSARHLPP